LLSGRLRRCAARFPGRDHSPDAVRVRVGDLPDFRERFARIFSVLERKQELSNRARDLLFEIAETGWSSAVSRSV
jgi:hypothetical protein